MVFVVPASMYGPRTLIFVIRSSVTAVGEGGGGVRSLNIDAGDGDGQSKDRGGTKAGSGNGGIARWRR
ncbi:hypothetical protein BC827DRAFT_1207429 [Russula dissimulans]|nr:hypothetical protein BC827DRAFT_1207429 [Russula dissimulans]